MRKMTVSENTLIKRINRKLNPLGFKLRTSPLSGLAKNHGRYYITKKVEDDYEALCFESHWPDKVFDLELNGRKLGCLADDEVLIRY